MHSDLFPEFVVDKVAPEVFLVLKLLNWNGQLQSKGHAIRLPQKSIQSSLVAMMHTTLCDGAVSKLIATYATCTHTRLKYSVVASIQTLCLHMCVCVCVCVCVGLTLW